MVKKTESLFFYKQDMGDTESLLDSGEPHGVPLNFNHPLLWHSSILRGMGIGQERNVVWIERSHKFDRETRFLVGGLGFKCTEHDSQEEVQTISQLFNVNKYGGFWIMNYPVSAGCTSWDLFGLFRRVGSIPNEITWKPGTSQSREGIVTSPLIKSPYPLWL